MAQTLRSVERVDHERLEVVLGRGQFVDLIEQFFPILRFWPVGNLWQTTGANQRVESRFPARLNEHGIRRVRREARFASAFAAVGDVAVR